LKFSDVERCVTVFIIDVPRTEATKEQKFALKADRYYQASVPQASEGHAVPGLSLIFYNSRRGEAIAYFSKAK
jgi:hypothetical protein